jgi:catechol 2,3-dioxygenase-like lactoylglutathione lyase family enzyme
VDTPVGELMNIVVDCPDADISARFWAAVLGWERVQENAGWVDIADASDWVYADPAGHPFCLVQLETT